MQVRTKSEVPKETIEGKWRVVTRVSKFRKDDARQNGIVKDFEDTYKFEVFRSDSGYLVENVGHYFISISVKNNAIPDGTFLELQKRISPIYKSDMGWYFALVEDDKLLAVYGRPGEGLNLEMDYYFECIRLPACCAPN